MSKRLIAAMLALLVSVSFSLNAIAASTPTVDLDAVFEEAKENYEASIRAKNRSIGEVQAPYYEEVELEDGSILVVEGYPTEYSANETEMMENESDSNLIYSLSEITTENFQITRTKTWGMLVSTLRYQENSSNSMVRISSFSYNLQLNSGYSLENINCYYFSFNSETDLSEYNDIDLETLSLIDFPTNRLGWVRSDTQAVELQMNTGVRYTLELNMVDEYMLQHNLVPFNFVEQ